MELFLLMVILPAVQDQNHTREWLKQVIRGWCSMAAWLLNLRSYLFGDVPVIQEEATPDNEDDVDGQAAAQPPAAAAAAAVENRGEEAVGAGLGAVHQALMLREGPTGFQPYNKPKMFAFRVRIIKIGT